MKLLSYNREYNKQCFSWYYNLKLFLQLPFDVLVNLRGKMLNQHKLQSSESEPNKL